MEIRGSGESVSEALHDLARNLLKTDPRVREAFEAASKLGAARVRVVPVSEATRFMLPGAPTWIAEISW